MKNKDCNWCYIYRGNKAEKCEECGKVLRIANRIEHRMTQDQLIASVGDIKRHAIPLYKCKDNVFPDQPRKERWKSCMLLIIDTYRHLGPQSFDKGSDPINL